MTFRSCRPAALALAFGTVLVCAPAQAEETDFLKRFDGDFSGSGSISRNETEKATNVRCRMSGAASENAVLISGTCRAAVIVSRKISADLQVDASGRYTGTYVGSSIGPARLSGKRSGDAINLTITWPKQVRGDTTAFMTIRNPGNGEITITITDEVPAGGPQAQVSTISLRQTKVGRPSRT